MAILFFLAKAFIISFSGAAQPGPVTTSAIAFGRQNRYAGIALSIGHGIIEFPLMVLIVLGLGRLFQRTSVQILIGFVGGIVLLIMAVQMLIGLRSAGGGEKDVTRSRPILTGIVLSASNPYFLLWWATIGLALASEATGFGIWAFVLFAIVHWSVDLMWVTALSWASFKGSTLMSVRNQRSILAGCATAMLLFGLKFIFDSVCSWCDAAYLSGFA
jgi:threonine/homoserine/homoserine lactone efflux protein